MDNRLELHEQYLLLKTICDLEKNIRFRDHFYESYDSDNMSVFLSSLQYEHCKASGDDAVRFLEAITGEPDSPKEEIETVKYFIHHLAGCKSIVQTPIEQYKIKMDKENLSRLKTKYEELYSTEHDIEYLAQLQKKYEDSFNEESPVVEREPYDASQDNDNLPF